MGFVTALLHLVSFVAPACGVALCTTLAARVGRAQTRLRWWKEWLLCSAAGSLALCGALWALGRDGTIAAYAALVACCATLSWLLSLRRR